jgi:PDDEXK-like domain of unknown function (DUF3799)
MEPLRFSILRQMARSPAHARYALDNEAPDTVAMRLGRLCHAVALDQATGPVWAGTRRGKAWDEFKAAHDGEDIVTEDEMGAAAAMAGALLTHQEARSLLEGVREKTIFFDFAGRKCRATPDVFDADNITELKSTYDASPGHFPYHAMRMGYHAQMAWQKDALNAGGYPVPVQLWIVAVESKPPYAVAVFQVTPRAEDFGRRLYRTWLEEFLNCERSNHWPGYGPGVIDAPEDAVELVGPDGEVLEVTDEPEQGAAVEGVHGNQGELPLIGLPPPLPAGIVPSKLSKSDADALAARRGELVGRQA